MFTCLLVVESVSYTGSFACAWAPRYVHAARFSVLDGRLQKGTNGGKLLVATKDGIWNRTMKSSACFGKGAHCKQQRRRFNLKSLAVELLEDDLNYFFSHSSEFELKKQWFKYFNSFNQCTMLIKKQAEVCEACSTYHQGVEAAVSWEMIWVVFLPERDSPNCCSNSSSEFYADCQG